MSSDGPVEASILEYDVFAASSAEGGACIGHGGQREGAACGTPRTSTCRGPLLSPGAGRPGPIPGRCRDAWGVGPAAAGSTPFVIPFGVFCYPVYSAYSVRIRRIRFRILRIPRILGVFQPPSEYAAYSAYSKNT